MVIDRTASKKVRLRKSTPRDLYFEDFLLPKWAQELDVLPLSILQCRGKMTHWFFRFSVCTGRVRRSPTRTIIRHCERLLTEIHTRREEILKRFSRGCTIKEDRPEHVLGQWEQTLQQMITLSQGKKSCTWYADAHPSDPLWPGNLEYVKRLRARGYDLPL